MNGEHELTRGYVHPGVGVTFKLSCTEDTRNSINAAAEELHKDAKLHSVTACEGLYLIERI